MATTTKTSTAVRRRRRPGSIPLSKTIQAAKTEAMSRRSDLDLELAEAEAAVKEAFKCLIVLRARLLDLDYGAESPMRRGILVGAEQGEYIAKLREIGKARVRALADLGRSVGVAEWIRVPWKAVA